METNLEKAKRLLKENAVIAGIELPKNGYIFEMLELAATPNIKRELLKGNYRQCFIDWKNKYFTYAPKTYDYKAKNSKGIYTLNDLHKSYEKAMLKSPFKQPKPTSLNKNE